LVLACTLVLALAGSASGTGKSHLIKLGRAIGPFQIGMSLGEVKSRLGKPDQDDGDQHHLYGASWERKGLGMTFDHRELVSVRTNNPGYKTPEGILFGSSQAELISAYDSHPSLCLPREDAEHPDPQLESPDPSTSYVACVDFEPKGRATVFNIDASLEVFVISVVKRKYLKEQLGQA